MTMRTRHYAKRSDWVQMLCPAPKRFLQGLIIEKGLTSGLDVGCGQGSLLSSVRNENFCSVGIDVHHASVERSKANQVHDEYVVGDFLSHDFERQFDVVVLSHVIEHFTRDAGIEMLRKAEHLARRLVYAETPHGFLEQKAHADNVAQRHLSGWFAHDFEARGYTVFGSGHRWLRGSEGRATLLPEGVTRLIERGTQRFRFRRPYGAHANAAIRYIDEAGDVRRL